MKKLTLILFLLAPLFVFGQTKINPEQIKTTPFKGDSAYLASPPIYIFPSGNIDFVGTSITAGTGASPSYNRYSSQTAFLSGFGQVNVGRPSTTLGNPYASHSSTSLINNLSSIPTKTGTDKWLIFEYVVNDIEVSFGYSSVTYATDLQTCLNYATAHGWSNSEITVGTSFYIDATINHNTMTVPQFQARIDSFNTAIRTVVTANTGMHLVDWNVAVTANGGSTLSADGTHPNNAGHLLGARTLVDVIQPYVYKRAQALAVNGTAAIQNLKLATYNFSGDTANVILVRDTSGNVHSSRFLPHNISLQDNLLTNGQIKSLTATSPTVALGNYDFLLPQDARLVGTFNGNGALTGSIKLVNNGGTMQFATTYSLGEMNFFVTSSAYEALSIKPTRSIWVGDGTNDGSFAANGDIVTSLGGKFFASSGGAIASFEPYISGETIIRNTLGGGSIGLITSGGSTGSSVQNYLMYAQGESAFRKGGTFTRDASALVSMYSTTQGFLPPSMTTTQQNAISSPTKGLIIFDNVLNVPAFYNGSTWVDVGSGTTDSTLFRTVANSYSLSGMQTKLGSYALLASPALTGTPTAPTASIGTNTTQLATTAFVLANAGGGTVANPTATIGLSAVNGSASSAIRSDGAPALSQAIVPTWTGKHTFNASVTAASGTAYGTVIGNTLTAAANNDITVGLNLSGNTFTNGAFTGVKNYDILASINGIGFINASSLYNSIGARVGGLVFTADDGSKMYFNNAGGLLQVPKFESTSTATFDAGLTIGTSAGGNYMVANGRYTSADNGTSSIRWYIGQGNGGNAAAADYSWYNNTTSNLSFRIKNSNGVVLIGDQADNAAHDLLQVKGVITSGIAGTTIGTYNLAGNTSGTISIKPQAAAGTYEFDMPTTAGLAGQMLTSQGGAGTAQTYTYPISKIHNISTPTTGGTVNLTNNQYNIINPAGALVALTVNLPSSPANNDAVYIKYTQAITTVTYGNGTVVDGITAPTAGGLVILVYDSGTTSWY